MRLESDLLFSLMIPLRRIDIQGEFLALTIRQALRNSRLDDRLNDAILRFIVFDLCWRKFSTARTCQIRPQGPRESPVLVPSLSLRARGQE